MPDGPGCLCSFTQLGAWLTVGDVALALRSINFVTHPPAITFFFIGALGVLVVEGQLLLMSSGLRTKIQAEVAGELIHS